MKRRNRCLVSAACLALRAPALAAGQDGKNAPSAIEAKPERRIEEIIVLARKRPEPLQDTPIAITAFGVASIKDLDIRDITDITQNAPNVQIDRAAGQAGSTRVYLRGAGDGDPISSDDPGVGIYIDGVYPRPSLHADRKARALEWPRRTRAQRRRDGDRDRRAQPARPRVLLERDRSHRLAGHDPALLRPRPHVGSRATPGLLISLARGAPTGAGTWRAGPSLRGASSAAPHVTPPPSRALGASPRTASVARGRARTDGYPPPSRSAPSRDRAAPARRGASPPGRRRADRASSA